MTDRRLGAAAIRELLPHRYPMLMVDAMVELEPGERGKGVKNVTCNEPFFQGHFPEEPIMPGVLLVECVAQVAGLVLAAARPPAGAREALAPAYLLSVDKWKFKRPVVPGDTLTIDVVVTKRLGDMARVAGEVRVGEVVVAAGEVTVGGGRAGHG